MSAVIDMTGWKMWEHGVSDSRLTVISHMGSDDRGEMRWLCECSCAEHNTIIATGNRLRKGAVKSCGCLSKELASKRLKKYNKYDLSGEYGIGWTLNTNREFYFELDRYDEIKDFCWYECVRKGTHYLQATDPKTKKVTHMYLVLGYKGYDHIDRNEFNNLICNLRPCTKQENARNSSLSRNNTSGITGVYFSKSREKWIANICVDKKTIYLGSSANKDVAIKMRLEAEKKYFGEFAPQKHLYEQYGI